MRVFICYRRDDSSYAADTLYAYLVQRLGTESVFLDASSIPAGANWEASIFQFIEHADVALVVIGPHWVRALDERGARRLESADDQLRRELELALRCGVDLIPVLLDRASMPLAADLPESLQIMTRLQAERLGRGSAFDVDAQRLLQAVRHYEGKRRHNAAVPAPGVAQKITGEHLALIYSCWRAPAHDARFPGHEVYRFDVIIAAEAPVLEEIEKVVYLLPPAWPTSPCEIADPASAFGLQELTWADLLVRARVHLRHQDEPVFLSCYVRLAQHGPRLVT
jgi:hypothetical protein